MNKHRRAIASSGRRRVSHEDFLLVPESLPIGKAEVKCLKFRDCPQAIMNECPSMFQNAERWCWLAAGTLSGLKVPATRVKPVAACSQCDIFMAKHSMRPEA
ncbi:MAG: hypothetical protein HQK99_13255 [Nitrospirae bacterium]|nr:hypothetical protein [Nitrospirota bacterium]